MTNPELTTSSGRLGHAWGQLLASAGALLAVYILFSVIAPASFRSLDNLENMARQSVSIGVVACGMTIVMIMGGIDLSAGSVAAFCCVVVAWTLQQLVPKPETGEWIAPASAAWIAAGVAMTCGMIFGLINGTLIAGLKMLPFIATLGFLLIWRGGAKGLAHEQRVLAPQCSLNGLLGKLDATERWMIFPPGVWILLAILLATAVLLKYTILGRQIFAVGSSERAARLCGIRVGWIKLFAYGFAGLMSGIAGVMQFSRLQMGDPTTAEGLELDAIAAVVIGGGSFSGGEGSILGTLIGACVMQVIKSGCAQMGRPNWEQQMVTGVIIVAAVALDRWRQHRMNG